MDEHLAHLKGVSTVITDISSSRSSTNTSYITRINSSSSITHHSPCYSNHFIVFTSDDSSQPRHCALLERGARGLHLNLARLLAWPAQREIGARQLRQVHEVLRELVAGSGCHDRQRCGAWRHWREDAWE